jgi:predicted porin
MKFRRIITVILLLASPAVFADALDISLNNNAAAFKYNVAAGALIQGNSDFHVGLLYNDSMNTMADVGLLVKGDEGDSPGFTLAVGAKTVVAMIKNFIPGTTQNVAAIEIGGEINYAFPAAKQLSAAFYYFAGPKITTFGDANRSNTWGLRGDYEISPGTKVYVEYREANFGIVTTGTTAAVDRGTYFGVKLSF